MSTADFDHELKAAELAKLRAETHKLAAEAHGFDHPRSAFSRWSGPLKEILTLLAGLAAAIGGGWAVVTGIELATVKKEMLTLETAQLQAGTRAARFRLDSLTARNRGLQHSLRAGDSTLRAAEAQAITLSRHTPDIEQALARARALVGSFGLPAGQVALVEHQLAVAEQQLTAAEQSAGYLSTDLQAATVRPARAGSAAAVRASAAPPEALARTVRGLFAAAPRARGAAYQELVGAYATAPTLVAALLAQARAQPANLNGIYNALVVLAHLPQPLLVADQAAVRQFLGELERQNLGPRINERTTKLQSRLGPTGR
ncbi:hypothetical protein [Hymenobacter volaticus]|uniref:Uncharacterized protein n=1 Tax=Hymenobacter volaticus TaxID=2932254 RepID=A0ABY4GDW3_9BACT|nr:hypothetical protein [Hymenobacter volaticus]UOQ69047.1 hypothetical protein MUN86_26455 [Hymenobacter volaticus]